MYNKKYINKNNKKTNSNKRKKRNVTFKMKGGNNNMNNMNIASSNNLLNQVKNERSFSLGKSDLFQKTSEIAQSIAIKTIENIGALLGIDLTNPQDIQQNLDKIKNALANPANKEKIKQIIGQISEILNIALEAASPFIVPLLDKTMEIGTKALSKIGEASVKIGLNTAEEIPGVGILIGTIRSLSNAMEAFLASVNAGEQLITSVSDSINATGKNFNRLLKEKTQTLNRINTSMDNFKTPLPSLNPLPSTLPKTFENKL